MSKQDFTKLFIADALKKLINQLPINKITIKRITEEAGISRQAFYYNFYDRKDLLIWIFRNDLADMVRSIDETDAYTCEKDLYPEKPYYVCFDQRTKIAQYWLKLNLLASDNKNLYMWVLGDDSDNLQQYLHDLFQQLYYDEIRSMPKGRKLKDADAIFLSDYFTCASIGYFILWVRRGMPKGPAVSDIFNTISHELIDHMIDLLNAGNMRQE